MKGWKKFPDTVPEKYLKIGKQIIIGGFTFPTSESKGGEWITAIVHFSKFKNSSLSKNYPILTGVDSDKNAKWIVAGFITTDNYPVLWKYWTEVPSLSFQDLSEEST